MKMNKGYRLSLTAVYGLCLLLLTGVVQAAVSVAQVASVVGNADVKRALNGNTVPLRFKSKIFIDDVVITGLGSQVKLLLKDTSIIKVGPRSEMKIGKLLLGIDDQSNTTIDLIKGRLRSIIGRRLGATSSYQVRTSVAVAGVRGTIFDGVHIPAEDGGRAISAFRTIEGLVWVGSTDPDIPEIVELEPNTFSMIEGGGAPSEAEPISEGENLEAKVKAKMTGENKDKTGKGRQGEGSGGKTGEGTMGEDKSNGTGGKLESAESEQIPKMELGDNSALGRDVAGEVNPDTRPDNPAVLPKSDKRDADILPAGVTDPSIGSSDQLNTVTVPAVDAVSIPLQISIPTP